MQRILTSLVGIPLVLAVIFWVPAEMALVIYLLAFWWAAREFVPMARSSVPSAPVQAVLWLIPLAVVAGYLSLRQTPSGVSPGLWLLAGTGLIVAAASCVTLFSSVELREGLASIGILSFATPYFAVPALSLYLLQSIDPWLVVLLLGIVWLGDSAAYFVGSRFGRRKLAPRVSPNKSWEGASASLAAGILAAAVWGLFRLEGLSVELLAVAAVTSVAAQIGDLVESLVKRGAGVKDSSNLLPGHGGLYDRLDAMMLSTPVFVVGLRLLSL